MQRKFDRLWFLKFNQFNAVRISRGRQAVVLVDQVLLPSELEQLLL